MARLWYHHRHHHWGNRQGRRDEDKNGDTKEGRKEDLQSIAENKEGKKSINASTWSNGIQKYIYTQSIGSDIWYFVALIIPLSFFKYLFMTYTFSSISLSFLPINNFLSAAYEKKYIIKIIYFISFSFFILFFSHSLTFLSLCVHVQKAGED